jgi:hypothetical protein
LRYLSALMILVLPLTAEIWVNAIRDPGAELGQGDWVEVVEEYPEDAGVADSIRLNSHDDSRAYEGEYSFLTDTDVSPQVEEGVFAYCQQILPIGKAAADIDSFSWTVFINESNVDKTNTFFVLCRDQDNKLITWYSGQYGPAYPDNPLYGTTFAFPDSGVWTEVKVDLYDKWVNTAMWSPEDTIVSVELHSWGLLSPLGWIGQDVSWDNIVLRSRAYYDYSTKSINSDKIDGGTYTPTATFGNEGVKDDRSGWVFAQILEGQSVVYADSQEVDIPAESTQQVEFSPWSVAGSGPFTLRVYPVLDLDEYSADDTLTKDLSGINEHPHVEVDVSTQITPRMVHFSFSPGIQGSLSIYDAAGREVYVHSIDPGMNELSWSTADIPAGLYFYKLSAGSSKTSGKLLILK